MWDVSAGEKHTLLLADGDCIQPIIYYSGQQVKEEAQEEEEEKEEGRGHQSNQQEQGEEEEEEQMAGGGGGGGGYTQQPVLLPFCMNVRTENRKPSLVSKPSVFRGLCPHLQVLHPLRLTVRAAAHSLSWIFTGFSCKTFSNQSQEI